MGTEFKILRVRPATSFPVCLLHTPCRLPQCQGQDGTGKLATRLKWKYINIQHIRLNLELHPTVPIYPFHHRGMVDESVIGSCNVTLNKLLNKHLNFPWYGTTWRSFGVSVVILAIYRTYSPKNCMIIYLRKNGDTRDTNIILFCLVSIIHVGDCVYHVSYNHHSYWRPLIIWLLDTFHDNGHHTKPR